MSQLRTIWNRPAVRHALILFLTVRLLLSLWGAVVVLMLPQPTTPDEVLRPYLDAPILQDGIEGLLLGPWQRFDTQHYLRIAREGYAHPADSVFPPLYPLAIRGLGSLLGGGDVADLVAAILLANLACLGLLILLHRVTATELDAAAAPRTLIYLLLFPTGFFLLAPYTESLFILLALAAIWLARNGRFWWAGGLGLLASLTRLTGWVLVVPLALAAVSHWRRGDGRKTAVLASLLPPLGLLLFLGYRWQVGLPPLDAVYADFWFQRTGFPGADLITAVRTLCCGGVARAGEFTLLFDLLITLFLAAATVWTFRRLGLVYGAYAALLLLFMLLPTSNLKPLYSFSRYALAFFPTFMLLGEAGKRPWLNRIILYPSLLLHLYFSGQYFLWGWVA